LEYPADQEASASNVLVWFWGREGASAKFALELVRELCKVQGLNIVLSCSRAELFASAKRYLSDIDIETVSTFAGEKTSLRGKLSAAIAFAGLPLRTLRFRRIFQRRRIDVALCTHSSVWDLAMLTILSRGSARYIQILHEVMPIAGDVFPLRLQVVWRQIATADAVIVLSEHVKRLVIDQFGFPADRVWKMTHGAFAFGSRTVQPAVHPRGVRPVRLLFFGHIVAYKGLERLLSAMHLLTQRGLPVELVVAGRGDLKVYHQLLTLANIKVHNRWLDEEEIASFLAASDIVVLPYSTSSQSGVVASAFTAGRPVVATPVGGLVEQVRHGATGLIGRDLSAEALADALTCFITDPDLLDRCAVKALQHARDELNWRDCAHVVSEAICAVRAMPRRCSRTPGHTPHSTPKPPSTPDRWRKST
jgi:glycosyltransferase involved in cell wall biosynthesis